MPMPSELSGAGCGDMLRMWLKFKDQDGKKVIDKASFQSFGCETAIAAAASLATELIKGKSTSEALALSRVEMAADLGPLPPTKIHVPPWSRMPFAAPSQPMRAAALRQSQ